MFKPQLLYKKQSQMKHLFKIKPWTTIPFKNISKFRQKWLAKKSKFACRKINYFVTFVTKVSTRFLEIYPAYMRNKTISSHQRKIDQTTPLASTEKEKRWSVNSMDCENGSSSQKLWTKCPKLGNFVCFLKMNINKFFKTWTQDCTKKICINWKILKLYWRKHNHSRLF